MIYGVYHKNTVLSIHFMVPVALDFLNNILTGIYTNDIIALMSFGKNERSVYSD